MFENTSLYIANETSLKSFSVVAHVLEHSSIASSFGQTQDQLCLTVRMEVTQMAKN